MTLPMTVDTMFRASYLFSPLLTQRFSITYTGAQRQGS